MKPLPIADAFRAILRSAHPERTDLQQIDSYQWFRDRKVIMVEGIPFHDQADEPAYAAHDLLKAGVKGQKIRLRGCLDGALPCDIDPMDAREGELDIFAGTLKLYAGKATLRTARTYSCVHCYADDLPLPKSKKSRAGRKAVYDWPEIRGFVSEQLTARGDFEEPDQIDGWKAAADLYRAIGEKFRDNCPELTTLKERVPAFVDEWRAKVGN
jgi:hypothetical protein